MLVSERWFLGCSENGTFGCPARWKMIGMGCRCLGSLVVSRGVPTTAQSGTKRTSVDTSAAGEGEAGGGRTAMMAAEREEKFEKSSWRRVPWGAFEKSISVTSPILIRLQF